MTNNKINTPLSLVMIKFVRFFVCSIVVILVPLIGELTLFDLNLKVLIYHVGHAGVGVVAQAGS